MMVVLFVYRSSPKDPVLGPTGHLQRRVPRESDQRCTRTTIRFVKLALDN